MFTHIPLCASELHSQWSIHSLQEQKTDHHLVFHHNHPTFLTGRLEKICTYSSDQAAVVWGRLNNDLFTLLSLSVVHWLMALFQHSLHTDLATLLILKPSWHACSIPTSSHRHWCSSCSLMSLSFNNISAVPRWTRPHSLQTHTNTQLLQLLQFHTVSVTATTCIFMSLSCESNYCYSMSNSTGEFYLQWLYSSFSEVEVDLPTHKGIHHIYIYIYIQGVPLPTKPGISLIILKPMKILQRGLNRSTFVVWEMKRNVSVVCVCFVEISSLVSELLKKCQIGR
jgi:hypothetical protein